MLRHCFFYCLSEGCSSCGWRPCSTVLSGFCERNRNPAPSVLQKGKGYDLYSCRMNLFKRKGDGTLYGNGFHQWERHRKSEGTKPLQRYTVCFEYRGTLTGDRNEKKQRFAERTVQGDPQESSSDIDRTEERIRKSWPGKFCFSFCWTDIEEE